jgi:ribosomal protein S18 acetylase RimI-like enzyme
MASIRPATIDDVLHMQNTNLWCLPENYNMKYYYYHILSWPQLLQVAEDHKGKVVGYVLAKMEDEDSPNQHGHITSLSVLRTHRKCGIATGLMMSSHSRMVEAFDADHVCLHVRETNHAAFHLYSQTLQYEINDIEKSYYADGENAYDMRKQFKPKKEAASFKGWGGRAKKLGGYTAGMFTSEKNETGEAATGDGRSGDGNTGRDGGTGQASNVGSGEPPAPS